MKNQPQTQNIFLEKIVIENPKGSYKKFTDSLDEYPILGVTFPCNYGYIDGVIGEDTHDLDVFLGSGNIFGYMIVKRDDVVGGFETKMLYKVSKEELEEIEKQYGPVVDSISRFNDEKEFMDYIQRFK